MDDSEKRFQKRLVRVRNQNLINRSSSIISRGLDLIKKKEPSELLIEIPGLPENAKKLEMVLIRGGSFLMGSPYNEKGRRDDEGPQHKVTITNDFYIGKYPVTQAQWEAIMGWNPSYNQGKPNHPVEWVSWNDCQMFLRKLNKLGKGVFRLPTEAEWEYSCRAGTTTRYSFGDALKCSDEREYCEEMDKYMWWDGNRDDLWTTREVGLKLPNPWGLYDMHGNVFEWCLDLYDSYSKEPQTDPMGQITASYCDSSIWYLNPQTGKSEEKILYKRLERIMRGGEYSSFAWLCRSSCRVHNPSYTAFGIIGFRLIRLYP